MYCKIHEPDFSPSLGPSPEAGFQELYGTKIVVRIIILVRKLISNEYFTIAFCHLARVRPKLTLEGSAAKVPCLIWHFATLQKIQ